MNSLKVANVIPISEANGPGPHYTIWVQGCSLKCPGCFNPQTHDPNGGFLRTTSSLVQEINLYWNQNKIRGVTITGGEPLQQIDSITHLLKKIKSIGEIGTIVLTGYNENELFLIPRFDRLRQFTDVLISGRFLQKNKLQEGIRGSTNKKVLLFSSFYQDFEFDVIPPIEIITHSDGTISITGIKPEILQGLFQP
ncbi:MAG: 4Fe-4S single cluster domain-containing protein, partial [Candidatus Thorarchaeota archaeon]